MIDYKKLSYIEGVILFLLAGVMAFPLAIDIGEGIFSFLWGIILCVFLGGVFFFSVSRPDDFQLNFREKVLFTIFNWICLPCVAAVPLIISVQEVATIDALFEIFSAMTATGSTIINDVRALSSGNIFWRSFIQVLGSMFFIITNLYIFSDLSRLISPNFEAKNDEKFFISLLKTTASIYLGLSFLSAVVLIQSGVAPLDSFCYAFGAISNGGMLPQIEYNFSNTTMNIVMILLMFISGLSILFFRDIFSRDYVIDPQVKYYVALIVLVVLALVLGSQTFSINYTLYDIVRVLFNVVSSITATGITDPSFEMPSVTYFLNFFGGCFGSCSGGVKILRLVVIFALLKNYMPQLVMPNVIHTQSYNNRQIDNEHLKNVFAYLVCYIAIAILLSGSCYDLNFSEAFGAIVTTMNGNGPYFGLVKASARQLSSLSLYSKWAFMLAMIAGRLEFIPLFVILTRSFWKKRGQ